jgi:hypothetical protein
MAGIDNQPAGTRESAADRRVQALRLRIAGASYRVIGEQLGVSGKTAWEDVHQALAELAALEQASAEELRALELARLDDLTLAATQILRISHPLVSGGKVLSGFTESGKVIGLTDDGPKLAAIDRLLRISESRRKLLGLDAPAKVAPVNPDGTPYETQQQTIGLVLGLLAPYPDLRLLLAAQLTEGADADVQE